uniref:3-hydroxyanthranilate 3,4-dioxygenase n=1 Tax=Oncorhynchus mykiss TaxID=8022 RepID=A0A8C7RS87_ONCMY
MSGKPLLNEKAFLPPVCNKLTHFCQLNIMLVCVCVTHTPCPPVSISGPQTFLLPARIPHSPQRLDNTVGLVLERRRLHSKTDCLRYHHPPWFYCENLRTQLVPRMLRSSVFFASEQHRTGKLNPDFRQPQNTLHFETATMLCGPGQTEVCKQGTDVWLWQQVQWIPPHVTLDGQEFPQSTGDSLLIPGHMEGRICLFVTQNPGRRCA